MRWIKDHGWVITFITLLAVLAGLLINYREDAETRRIVTESPCQIDAASRECQDIRRAGEKAESARVNCISFLRAGYPCPREPITGDKKDKKRQEGSNEPSTDQPSASLPGSGYPESDAGSDGSGGSGDGGLPSVSAPPPPQPGPPGDQGEPGPVGPPGPSQPPAPDPPSVLDPLDSAVCNLPVRLCG